MVEKRKRRKNDWFEEFWEREQRNGEKEKKKLRLVRRTVRKILGEKMTENKKKNNEKEMPSFDLGIGGFFERFRPSKPKKAKQKEKTGEKEKRVVD